MDAEIATMVAAFIGFCAAGLFSWRQMIARAGRKDRSADEASNETDVVTVA